MVPAAFILRYATYVQVSPRGGFLFSPPFLFSRLRKIRGSIHTPLGYFHSPSRNLVWRLCLLTKAGGAGGGSHPPPTEARLLTHPRLFSPLSAPVSASPTPSPPPHPTRPKAEDTPSLFTHRRLFSPSVKETSDFCTIGRQVNSKVGRRPT